MIFIQIRSVVLGIHHLESRLYYELFYYAQSYIPLLSLFKWRHPFVMHLIIHMFNTSMIPYISIDLYLNPNLNTLPNMQNMRFFCCPVYIKHMYNACVTAFNLFVKEKTFPIKAFVLIDFFEIRNFKIIELVCTQDFAS